MKDHTESGAKAILKFAGIGEDRGVRWKSHLLGEAPGARRVVGYRFYRFNKPVLSCIAKFYADERGKEIADRMALLCKRLGWGTSPPLLAVPQPLFYDSTYRFIAQQPAEGVPFGEALRNQGSRTPFRLAGRALGMLHAQPLSVGKSKSIQGHLHDLIHPHPNALAEEMPEYGPLIGALLHALSEREETSKAEASPLHRDFHLRQLFYEPGRIWLVDWDLFAKGDPALDLGNFAVYLKTHLTRGAAPAVDAFLDGYFSGRPGSILKRVPLYEAFTFLRLACKRFRLKEAGWREKTAEMLLLSEKSLMKEPAYGKV